jgi:hypothetical protein
LKGLHALSSGALNANAYQTVYAYYTLSFVENNKV